MTMPTVSIIIPVYNAENSVSRCVDSILKQEYGDFELLLIDDGSTDSSPAILDELAEKDSRIRIIHQANSGVSASRNRGLDEAAGTYVQFLDADDWMTNDSSKLMVRLAEEKKCDMVIADFYRVVGGNLSRKGNILSDRVLNRQEYAEYMMESPADYYYGVLWNKLYRRSLLEQFHIRMDESISFCEDFIFNLEYVLHCSKICALQVPVYYYVKTSGSLVARNLNPLKLMEMKTSVFQYYDRFFRNILDEATYRADRLSIARFLIAAADDDMTIPLMPGTKRVGKETVNALYYSDAGNLVTAAYYQEKLYERYLNSIAMKYDLDLSDVRVFEAVRSASGKCTQKDISDYTGISQMAVLASLQKLQGRHFIHIGIAPLTLEVGLDSEASEPLLHDMDQAMRDLLDVCLAGFSETERRMISELYSRINVNVRKALGQDLNDE